MRIISGKYKGKKLYSLSDDSVRPTTDRIKETVFNILQKRVFDSRVLDLFAGSGALGIECLSRGAGEVIFVDNNRASIDLIKKNLAGIDGNYKVIQSDFHAAISSLSSSGEKFDLVFVDAPYLSGLGEKAVNALLDSDMLSPDGMIAYEHSTSIPFSSKHASLVIRDKKMGTVTFDFIRRKSVGVVTGTFDPFTIGHEAIVDEALRLFDEVVIACLVNPDKECYFSPEERVKIAMAPFEGNPRVKVIFSDDMATDVAQRFEANALVRGLRNGEMTPYEKEMAEYNEEHGVKTVFVSPDISGDISSTQARKMIKEGDFRLLPKDAILVAEGIFKDKH